MILKEIKFHLPLELPKTLLCSANISQLCRKYLTSREEICDIGCLKGIEEQAYWESWLRVDL